MSTNNSFNSDLSYVSAKGLVTRRNQDGTIILMKSDDSSFFYRINGLAADIWLNLASRKTVSALREHYIQVRPERAEEIGQGILRLLEILFIKGLVVAEGGPTGPFTTQITAPQGAESTEFVFGELKEFNLEHIETEDFHKSANKDIYQDVYLDVFAGSDLRLKKDVEPIEGALAKVIQLNGIKFRWDLRTAKTSDQTLHAGLVAQDVAAVMPEVVRVDKDRGLLAVEYSKINSYLVEAIKELHSIVNQQGAQIQELQERLGGTYKN